ncbi:MAG: hypothetical protein ACRDRJ_08155 [Streptosporangiaceae bacterium]
MKKAEPLDRPPACQLLFDRREAMVPRMSRYTAARLAGMPESTWRAAERGEPGRCTAETLARMAVIVDVAPEDFRRTAAPDAARALRSLMQEMFAAAAAIPPVLREAVAAELRADRDGLLAEVTLGLADIGQNAYLTGRQKGVLRQELLDGIVRDLGEKGTDVRAVLRVAPNSDVV